MLFNFIRDCKKKFVAVYATFSQYLNVTLPSGEDRIVKKSFKELKNLGIYEDVCRNVIRPSKEECHRNSRAKSTKMRWAIKAK